MLTAQGSQLRSQRVGKGVSLEQPPADEGKKLLYGLKPVPEGFRPELQIPDWKFFIIFIIFQKEKVGDLISAPRSFHKPQNIV